MNDLVDRQTLEQCRIGVREEIDDILKTVHQVRDTKQDKVLPRVWVPVILWAAGVTFSGLVWAINLNAQVNYLQKLNEAATVDRYYGKDAERDFALRDQRILENQAAIKKNYEMIEELRRKHQK